MKKKKLPKLYDPMAGLIQGNMHGIPQILEKALPVPMKKMSYDDDPISMIFGTWRRKKMAESSKFEMEIAQNNKNALVATLDGIHEVLTYSSRTTNTLQTYEHLKTMRYIEADEGRARVTFLHLEAEEKKAKIQQINYQTALIAQEVELSKIETQIKSKQLKDILGEEVA